MPQRELTSQVQREEWNLLLQHSPQAHYFQSPDYYDFLLQQNYLTPFLYAVRRDGQVRALVCGYIQADGNLLMRYFSRRAIILGGILPAHDCNHEDVTCLMKHLVAHLHKKVIYIEIRNFMPYDDWKLPMQEAGFAYQLHYDVHVDATNKEQMLQRMNKRRQRQIRADQRNGHTWRQVTAQQDLASFYTHLQRLYKHKVRRPLLPKQVIETALRSPHVHLLLTEYNNTLTGGLLCVKWGGVCYAWYEWGDMYTTWAGMEWAHNEGCHLFDFMGAGSPSLHYGVRDFKLSMGGELKEFGRFRYVANQHLYTLGSWVVNRCLTHKQS
ncbi:MAG: hypothetical protein J6P99_02925 [Paludibacteraceae bacterium]|nr:hypothetical protein [Paludibacteraceae bacterium]